MTGKKIVTIGGGSGQFVLLSALRDIPDTEITAVVAMVDSGGSTGRLRDELGILPPGDILKCLLALSPFRSAARQILQTRFGPNNRLQGHNAGNMLLSMMSKYSGSFPEGVNALGEILNVKGRVLPVTVDRATLVAELSNGARLFGEQAIDVPRGDQREVIKNVYLVPHHKETISVYPPVLNAITEADLIIIGPGDIYTSLIPNLLVSGVNQAIQNSKAKVAYIVNLMTKFGETEGFKTMDFVQTIEKFLERQVDLVISNWRKPSRPVLAKYAEQKATPVLFEDHLYVSLSPRKIYLTDLINSRNILRHSPKKLAKLLAIIFSRELIQISQNDFLMKGLNRKIIN